MFPENLTIFLSGFPLSSDVLPCEWGFEGARQTAEAQEATPTICWMSIVLPGRQNPGPGAQC